MSSPARSKRPSFAWCLRSRRLVRDYERRTDTSEAVTLWSMTMLMSRRMAARGQGPVPAPGGMNLPGFAATSQPCSTSRFSRALAPSTREADALSQPSTTAARRAPSQSPPASTAAAINA
ncbi:hypothetical protein SUDANB145_03228 [Streptomyces sp. enrichment culture]